MNYRKLLFGTSIICGIALTLLALVPDRIQGMLNSNILAPSALTTSTSTGAFNGYTFGYVLPSGTYQEYIGTSWTGGDKGWVDQLYYNFMIDGYGGLPLGSCLQRSMFITNATEKATCAKLENSDLFRVDNNEGSPAKNVLIKNATLKNAFRVTNAVGGTTASGIANDVQTDSGLPHTDTFQVYMGPAWTYVWDAATSSWIRVIDPARQAKPEWLVIQDSVIKNSDNGAMIVGDTWFDGFVFQNLSTLCEPAFKVDANARNQNDKNNFIGSYINGSYPCGGQIGAEMYYHADAPLPPVWLINASSELPITINNPVDNSNKGPVIVIGPDQDVRTKTCIYNNGWQCTPNISHSNEHRYDYIEDAIAAGYPKPPYVELSCSGWRNPPAGCTTGQGYLGGGVIPPVSSNSTLSVTKVGNGTVTGTGISCGTDCSETFTIANNTSVTLTATPANGSTFTGWSGGGCSGTGTCTVIMSANTSVTATFNTPVLPYAIGNTIEVTGSPSINVRSSAGSATNANVIGTQPLGATGTLISGPINSDGWTWWNINYDSGVDGWSSQELLEVTRVGDPITFTLTTSVENGTITKSPNKTAYTNGEQVTLTATPNAGFQFSSWTGCTSTTATCSVTMTADKSVTANFTLIPVTTFTLISSKTGTGTGTITGNTSPYTSGTTATLTATPSLGSLFTSWTGCTSTSGTTCTVSMTSNKTVTANFTLIPVITYTLTTSATNGTVSGGGTYTANTSVTLTATPNAGFQFSSWTGCTSTTATCTVIMSANKTVIANFTLIPISTYTLTASVTNGSITGNTSPYASGATATLTAVANSGYAFTSWIGCTTTSGTTCTVLMNANKSVTATFTAATTRTLTTSTTGTGTGTITGNASPYVYGRTATITAVPAANSTFAGWSGACSGTNPTCTLKMTRNRSVSAKFDVTTNVTTYTLITSALNGTISGNTSPYASGATATLTATLNSDYTFSGWSGACTGTGVCTVTMDANKSVTATFTLIPVTSNLIYQNANTLTLDGTSAGTEIAVDDSKITNKLTVSAWITRSSDAGSYPSIVADEDYAGNKGYYLGDLSSGTNNPICFRVNGGAGNNSIACESSAVTNSTAFIHYVGVFDGTTQTISLYRDGTLVSQKSHPSTSVSIDTGTELLGAGWKGQIKDVKIFNKVSDGNI